MDDLTVKLPSWQACESCGADVVPQIDAKISQNAAYGGIEVQVGREHHAGKQGRGDESDVGIEAGSVFGGS